MLSIPEIQEIISGEIKEIEKKIHEAANADELRCLVSAQVSLVSAYHGTMRPRIEPRLQSV